MAKYVHILLTTENNDSVKITNAHAITQTHLRFQFTVDDGTPKIRDYHIGNAIRDVTLGMGNDILAKTVLGGRSRGTFEDIRITICGGKRKTTRSLMDDRLPYDFTDRDIFREEGTPSLKDATPDSVVEIVPETGQEFHDRLMPFLHDAAWGFIRQAHPLHHEIKNKRYKNSALRVKLPIGYLARELDRHTKGNSLMTYAETETLVREVKDAFTTDNTWYDHHLDHDVSEVARMHEKLRFAFERPDGSEWKVNLREFVESGEQASNDFALLRTYYFQQALYTSREYITERKLVWRDKE